MIFSPLKYHGIMYNSKFFLKENFTVKWIISISKMDHSSSAISFGTKFDNNLYALKLQLYLIFFY